MIEILLFKNQNIRKWNPTKYQKEFYIMNKWDLFQVSKAGSTVWNSVNIIYHINRLKKNNYVIISIAVEKVLDKIQHPLMKKISQQTRNREEHPQLGKEYLQTLQLTSYLNDEKLDVFLFDQKHGIDRYLLFPLFKILYCKC